MKNLPEERGEHEGGSSGDDAPEREVSDSKVASTSQILSDEKEFTKLLNDELKKFNRFFMNAEEDLVMRDRELGDAFHRVVSHEGKESDGKETKTLIKKYADFHGELVLLEHWTSLNYTALVKILKKHDKRSSVSLRSPFLLSALHQPFYSTEVLLELIKKTETRFKTLHELIPKSGDDEKSIEKQSSKTPPSLARTKAAISCWDGMKDEDSVKRPFGDAPKGIGKRAKVTAA